MGKQIKPKTVALSIDQPALLVEPVAARVLRQHFGADVIITHVKFGASNSNTASDKKLQAYTDAKSKGVRLRKFHFIAVAVTHMSLYDNPARKNNVVVCVHWGPYTSTKMGDSFATALSNAMTKVRSEIVKNKNR